MHDGWKVPASLPWKDQNLEMSQKFSAKTGLRVIYAKMNHTVVFWIIGLKIYDVSDDERHYEFDRFLSY